MPGVTEEANLEATPVVAPSPAAVQDAFTAQFLAATNAQAGRGTATAAAPPPDNPPATAAPGEGQPAATVATPAATTTSTPGAATTPHEEPALSPEDEQAILERAGLVASKPETV